MINRLHHQPPKIGRNRWQESKKRGLLLLRILVELGVQDLIPAHVTLVLNSEPFTISIEEMQILYNPTVLGLESSMEGQRSPSKRAETRHGSHARGGKP